MQLDKVLTEIENGDLSLDELTDFYRKLKGIVLERRKAIAKRTQIPEVLRRRTTYQVKLSKVAPAQARERLHHGGYYDRCVLAVSLETDKFEGEKLQSLLGWIDSRFERCLVLVDDILLRLTLGLTEDLSAEQAVSEARKRAETWVERNQARVDQLGDCHFKVRFLSEIAEHPRRAPLERALRRLYDRDRTFRHSVNVFARGYATRVLAKRETDPQMVAAKTRIGREYMIQEMGFFGTLAGEKWRVICYPGNINTFVDIANGKFEGVPSAFKHLVYCALALKKRGIRFQDEPQDETVYRPARKERKA